MTEPYTITELPGGFLRLAAGGVSKEWNARQARSRAYFYGLVADNASRAKEDAVNLADSRIPPAHRLPVVLTVPQLFRMVGELYALAYGILAALSEPEVELPVECGHDLGGEG